MSEVRTTRKGKTMKNKTVKITVNCTEYLVPIRNGKEDLSHLPELAALYEKDAADQQQFITEQAKRFT